MKSCVRWLGGVLLCMAFGVHAEGGTCPPGYHPIYTPGVTGCAPIPGYDDESGSSASSEPAWETRWGAVAAGGGGFGAAKNASSRRQAMKEAQAVCLKNNQGKGCGSLMTYHDECFAVASGDTFGLGFESPDIEQAKQGVLAACSKKSTGCVVIYAECSYPARVR